MASYCCQIMKRFLEFKCEEHDDPHDCGEYIVARFDDEIGIPIRDGGTSFSVIDFCPWCGSKLDPTMPERFPPDG